MKTLKNLMLGVLVVVCVVLFSSMALAKGKHHKIDLDVIKNAAMALQSTRPDLSAGLTKYVDEEKKEDLEKKKGKTEKESASQEAVIKLFKDSATALQLKNPELAKNLTKYAQWKQKRLSEKKEAKEASEKDETKDKKLQK